MAQETVYPIQLKIWVFGDQVLVYGMTVNTKLRGGLDEQKGLRRAVRVMT